jgi:hypothetical protein
METPLLLAVAREGNLADEGRIRNIRVAGGIAVAVGEGGQARSAVERKGVLEYGSTLAIGSFRGLLSYDRGTSELAWMRRWDAMEETWG